MILQTGRLQRFCPSAERRFIRRRSSASALPVGTRIRTSLRAWRSTAAGARTAWPTWHSSTRTRSSPPSVVDCAATTAAHTLFIAEVTEAAVTVERRSSCDLRLLLCAHQAEARCHRSKRKSMALSARSAAMFTRATPCRRISSARCASTVRRTSRKFKPQRARACLRQIFQYTNDTFAMRQETSQAIFPAS